MALRCVKVEKQAARRAEFVPRFKLVVGIVVMLAMGIGCRGGEPEEGFSGERALDHVRTQVSMGPRPPGSEASGRLRSWLRTELEALGFQVQEQPFTPRTPLGPVPMVNLVATLPGASERRLVLGAHADTKRFEEFEFLGANDGASGVAALLELARVFHSNRLRHTLTLAFFDGEEALVEWGPDDSLYGSTHLVDSWVENGLARKVSAVFILDMVGDRNLKVTDEVNSHPQLRARLREEAARLGHSRLFSGPEQGVEDDHVPFLMAGIPALNVIGFATSPEGVVPSYWHTPQDTLDKVSASSLEAVGRTVEACLRRLDRELLH